MRYRAATALFAISLTASAAPGQMAMNAEIVGSCTVDSVRPLDFGELTQSTASPDRVAVGGVAFWCSLGFSYQVTVDSGLNSNKGTRRMRGQASTNSEEYLSYSLRDLPGANIGGGPRYPEFLEMEATVRGVNYDPLPIGLYADTLVVTISP
jgi:spore coat protein U-like protein